MRGRRDERQLEELKALRAENFPWDWRTCAGAAGGGHLGTLQWARARARDERTCAHAAGAGPSNWWARENGCPWTCTCAGRGAATSNAEVARENGCPWDCGRAVRRRAATETLKWARENGCPWDEGRARRRRRAATSSAEVGAHERPPRGRGDARRGLSGRHLNVLKWACANAARGTWTCEFAALGGHLDVLKWARENDCPWSVDVRVPRRSTATSRC